MTQKEISDNRSKNASRRNRRGGSRSRGRGRGGTGTTGRSGRNPNGINRAVSSVECSVCTNIAKDWAVGDCMHPVCGNCSHRMRVLYKREACVLCNTLLSEVTVVPVADFRKDAQYSEMRSLAKVFDEDVRMHFVDPTRQKQLSDTRGFKCKLCNYIAPTGPKLKHHARFAHNSIYCNLCFSGGNAFISELDAYPYSGERGGGCPKLREHMKHNHPTCKFCHHAFLGDDELYAHLQSEHETCGICERAGRIHEYYRSFVQLEQHYRQQHFVCNDPGCRGLVFATRVDLQGHQINAHADSLPRSARRVRVDLADLGPPIDPEEDLRQEQQRQAARRRAFAASNVVFSGHGSDMPPPSSNGAQSDSGPGSVRGGRSHVQQSVLPAAAPSNAAPRNPAPPPNREPPGRAAPPPSLRAPTVAGSSAGPSSQSSSSIYKPLALPQNQEEADERSRQLVHRMRTALDPAAFEQFREASGDFREGVMDANDYYKATVDVFGVRQALRDIFPELIALLPDANKRTELTNALNGRHNSDGIAPQSTIEFPSLSSTNRAPAFNPRVRTHYMPVPQSGDFPSLEKKNRSGGPSSAASSSSRNNGPQFDINRVFGGTQPPPPNLPTPRRTLRNLSEAFGPFPTLGGHRTTASAPPPPLRSIGAVRESQGTTPLHMSAAVRAPPTRVPATRLTRAPPPAQPPPMSSNAFPGLGDSRSRMNISASTNVSGSYPSLGVISAAILPPENASLQQDHTGETRTEAVPDSDATISSGAVWGGAASSSRRKRGVGGRTLAQPPPGMGLSSNMSSDDSSSSGSRPMLLDLRQQVVERRQLVEHSSLPKVGGSGFGFNWERKKNMKKKQQIKNAFSEAQGAGDEKAGASGNSSTTNA